MEKETNLERIKEIACGMLSVRPLETDMSPMIVDHPFTRSGIVSWNDENYQHISGNIMDDEKFFDAWQEMMKKQIESVTAVHQIFFMISKPYSLAMFQDFAPHLSQEDFSDLLSNVWMEIEYPNADPNVNKRELVSMFKSADPKKLMDEEEYEEFSTLDDKLTIYRGVVRDKPKNVKALSWTLDKDTAQWFADRGRGEGAVYEANIDKEHIFALFTRRNEDEIVVDPKFLTNIHKIEQEATFFQGQNFDAPLEQ